MSEYRFVCTDCGKASSKEEALYLCPACQSGQVKGRPPLGVLKVEFDYQGIKKRFSPGVLAKSPYKSQERYLDLIPLDKISSLPPLPIGPTPLLSVERLRKKLGLAGLYVKNDTSLPTGSLKDRASSIVVAKARELKKDVIVTASTGNAATALAGMCASVGQKSVIYVPASAPKAKLTQIAMFGAKLVLVNGTYDDAFRLSIRATEKFGWYNRNTAYNPYTIEGKKTAALEIWEQLNFKAPDKILIPTGDGVILSGIYKGFYDLKMLGLIERIPQLIAVQAEGSCSIVKAMAVNGCDPFTVDQVPAKTIADSISVTVPACGRLAVKVIRETNGFGLIVTDDEIIFAIKELAEYTGVFAESAAAAAYAGLLKGIKEGSFSDKEKIVLLITGSGLKDIPNAMKAVTFPQAIEPDDSL